MKILEFQKEPYRVTFELEGLPEMTNRVLAMRLRERMNRKKFWKELVFYGLAAHRPAKPFSRARLTLTRCSSDRPDPDGLTSGFKHIIDALKTARVITEDKHENIGFPSYRWTHASKAAGKILVTVEQLPDNYEHPA